MRPIFLIAAGIAALGLRAHLAPAGAAAARDRRRPGHRRQLRGTARTTSLDELETRLSILARKQERHRVYEHLIEEAGVDLSAPAAWLLLRIGEAEAGLG